MLTLLLPVSVRITPIMMQAIRARATLSTYSSLLYRIANTPIIPLTLYMRSTARLCPKPAFMIRWCRCSLSAVPMDCPLRVLLIIAMTVSKIGRPRTRAGITSTTSVALLALPSRDSAASAKPRSCEPPSPIKVLAG